LLGSEGLLEQASPAQNVSDDPRKRFEIDAQALIDAHRAARAGGPQVIGYYHSHPRGPAQPSAVDRAQAAHDGAVWAIVSPAGVAFFRDDKAGFEPLPYTEVDR
jgi:proteasome lid subunit RPN8/RPN11